jgi:hypothetical protein
MLLKYSRDNFSVNKPTVTGIHFRSDFRIAQTADRWAQGKKAVWINQALFFYIFEKRLDYEYFRAEIKDI